MNERNVRLLARYERHPMKAAVVSALTTAEKFVERAAGIKENRNLSELGRTKELHAQIKSALRDIRDAGAPIDGMKTKLATLVASIKPASFDKSDLSGAMLRSELRTALRGMSLAEKAAILLGEKADPAFVDAALEGPGLLSGVDPQMFAQVREQRLENLFTQESLQVESLTDQIAEAEAALEIARGDVSRASGLQAHEFAKIAEAVHSRKSPVWLKKETRGGEEVVVVAWPLDDGKNTRRVANSDDLYNGRYYENYEAYLADRAA
jgi:hypothetical protein